MISIVLSRNCPRQVGVDSKKIRSFALTGPAPTRQNDALCLMASICGYRQVAGDTIRKA